MADVDDLPCPTCGQTMLIIRTPIEPITALCENISCAQTPISLVLDVGTIPE